MIISKWVKILAAKRNNSPLPKINLEKFYEFLPEKMMKNEPYTKSDFLDQVDMDDVHYDTLAALLKNKKNLILQGAPGVGKTFAAKRLAYAIMEEMDDSRIEFIQFHQNYSYEDFIMGYKPCGEGFQIGHSYFCGQNRVSCTEEWMKFVVYHEIIPLLREYWFDDKETVQRWENNLSGVFNDE